MESPAKPHSMFVKVSRKVIMTSGHLSRSMIRWMVGLLVTMLLFIVYVTTLSASKHPTARSSSWFADWQIWPYDTQRHRVQGRYDFHVDPERVVREDWDYDALMASLTVVPSCKNAAHIIVVITTAVEHLAQRTVIRQTWCSGSAPHADKFQCVFLLGQSDDLHMNMRIMQESKDYGDLLIARYTDTYRNLSLKVLTGLHWAVAECKASYILKTDDDCFVNTAVLTPFLLIQPLPLSSLYIGIVQGKKNIEVVRDPSSRWDVAHEQYAPAQYPAYASGAGYILSSLVIKQLLEASRHFRPFPNEDAYVGVLANSINVPPIHSDRFTLLSTGWKVCNLRYLLVMHGVSQEKQREFQDMVDRSIHECYHEADHTTWR